MINHSNVLHIECIFFILNQKGSTTLWRLMCFDIYFSDYHVIDEKNKQLLMIFSSNGEINIHLG